MRCGGGGDGVRADGAVSAGGGRPRRRSRRSGATVARAAGQQARASFGSAAGAMAAPTQQDAQEVLPCWPSCEPPSCLTAAGSWQAAVIAAGAVVAGAHSSMLLAATPWKGRASSNSRTSKGRRTAFTVHSSMWRRADTAVCRKAMDLACQYDHA
jgi:hypothetical protein